MGGGGSDSIDKAKLNSINSLTDIGKSQVALGQKADARQQKAFDATDPYFRGRMKEGLPYFNALTDQQGGLTHQAFAPARGAMERRLANMGDLPSGFAEQNRIDLDSAEARAFDSNLQSGLFANDQAKFNAAQAESGQIPMFNPGQYYSGASSAYGNAGNINPTQAQPNAGAGAAGGAIQNLLQYF